MKTVISYLSTCYIFSASISIFSFCQSTVRESADTVIVLPGFVRDKISPLWLEALKTRMTSDQIDSLSGIRRELTIQEKSWKNSIESKISKWNSFRDSLSIPFKSRKLSDTIYILTGYAGFDDGFTYGSQTVCLDLTALQREYGDADLPENDTRIDRLFAHEYTHLLHKAWAAKINQNLRTFRDSILWECLYEGMGMYRSLNTRWLPVQRKLPDITLKTLQDLYPVFSDRLQTIRSNRQLTFEEKTSISKNLSRGPVNKKWGAFTVAIWLALEANGNDRNLVYWIEKGPEAVILLSRKHLTRQAY